MKIILIPKESEEYFYSALCNGLGQFQGYGGILKAAPEFYKKAKEALVKATTDKGKTLDVCYEDVYMQILQQGDYLQYIDCEDSSLNTKIYLKDIHEKVSLTDAKWLVQMKDEQDDADTADAILQTVILGSIIFG